MWGALKKLPAHAAAAQVTDKGVQHLVGSLTSLVTLNVIGCHRLTPRAKEQVRLIRRACA